MWNSNNSWNNSKKGWNSKKSNNWKQNQQRQQKQQSNEKPPKFSGVTYSQFRKGEHEGMPFVYAWNLSRRRGMQIATVKPYKNTYDKNGDVDIVKVEKKDGSINEYYKMICIYELPDMKMERAIACLMNIKTQVIVLEDIEMCITPNSDGRTTQGKYVTGYFGRYK